MFELKIRQEIGLGNGTRKRGEILAIVTLLATATLESFLLAAWNEEELPAQIEKSDGVLDSEIATVLRNSHLFEFVRIGVLERTDETDPDEDDSDDTDLDDDPDERSWTHTPLQELGLEEPALRALVDAGMGTIQDVLEHGAAHGTLTKISGIGKATEEKIKAATEALEKRETSG